MDLFEFVQNHYSTQTLIPAEHLPPSDEPNTSPDLAPISGSSSYTDSPDQPDYYEACLGYIHDILMEEEDSEDSISILPDFGALVATEKSFYNALLEESNYPSSSSNQYQSFFPPSTEIPTDECLEYNNWILYQDQTVPGLYTVDAPIHSLDSNSWSLSFNDSNLDSQVRVLVSDNQGSGEQICEGSSILGRKSQTRKVHQREDENNLDSQDSRSIKQLTSFEDDDKEHEVIHQYDDILLPKNEQSSVQKQNPGNTKPTPKGRKSRSKKKSNGKAEVVDLRTLLSLCAQAVAGFDLKTANELLKQIRHHSSPYGDCIQRVAHYFANGLEARMAGTGSQLYYHFVNSHIPPSTVLKSYECYATAVPIFRTSFYVSNMMIARLSENATRIHVIDFGIYHGFQWPSFIQRLSERLTGPPKLKITGIDLPLMGFRPAEKVEQTGRRLKAYCERFNVPFEYHAIAKPWETIREEDIKIEEGELVIVNCQYRATTLLDETVDLDSPRDAFLRLIRNLKPDIFIHGSLNGTYGVPFFLSRFREALFNFISMFDIYESTMPREDNERMLIEKHLHGTEILNVVASEGSERVARPETYKQWQVRTVRAGFRQMPIHRDLVRRTKEITKSGYHKDFVVDEDGNWMLQGWKGRILFAISCWKPAEN